MQQRALITAASNKYFPSLINLLGSIKKNYQRHPKIYVYNLGLAKVFLKELQSIENLEIIRIPPFVPFWRSCYTWKTYIFAHPLAEANFYLDAGCQVLKPLDDIFDELEQDGYFLISQGGKKFFDIVPSDYKEKFHLPIEFDEFPLLHAGVFGFKKNSPVQPAIDFTFEQAKQGLTLGFSTQEQWRNRGADKNNIVRDCPLFRHDMTLFNVAFRKFFGTSLKIHPEEKYAGWQSADQGQYIWQMRLSYRRLEHLSATLLHPRFSLLAFVNRLIISIMIFFKNINLSVKKLLGAVR